MSKRHYQHMLHGLYSHTLNMYMQVCNASTTCMHIVSSPVSLNRILMIEDTEGKTIMQHKQRSCHTYNIIIIILEMGTLFCSP